MLLISIMVKENWINCNMGTSMFAQEIIIAHVGNNSLILRIYNF